MACTNPQNPQCPNCNKSGLAILPTRYAVVPIDIDATVPPPMGNKVTDVKLAHHKYALRTLRAGFVYIFHEKHPRGSHIKWEVYGVSEAGTLWKMPSVNAIKTVDSEPQCSRDGHNLPASVITIETPEKCKRIWIAFSEHIWSDETLADFEKDTKLRDRRMQTFLPATWITAGGYRHGLPATKSNIEQILEYKTNFLAESLNKSNVPKISKPQKNGAYFSAYLKRESTVHTAVSRAKESEALSKLMSEIGKNPKGADHQPLVIALWDAIGIAHELNGFRNEVVGWSQKYLDELELEVAAMVTIDGLKEVLGERAAQKMKENQENPIMRSQPETLGIRARAAQLSLQEQARTAEICDFIDDLRAKTVPPNVVDSSYLLGHVNQMPEPARSKELAKLRAQADQFLNRRATFKDKNVEDARAGAWKKYEDKLDKPLYLAFKKNFKDFQTTVSRIAEERTTDLVSWLGAKNLIDALTEFHGKSVRDGVAFDDQIGRAIFGMNDSRSGKEKITAWVTEMKATETNLLWRAMALNQIDAMPELDAYLQEAKQKNDKKIIASSIDWLAVGQKSLKATVDTYKKALSIYNANVKAASEKGSMAFNVQLKPIKTKGIDFQIMATGDAIMKFFRINGILDYAGEKMVQHLLNIRLLVDPMDSLQLIQAQALNEGVARELMISRLSTAETFLASERPQMKAAQVDNMRRAWTEFRKSESSGNAIKDVRAALLVMLIEGVNFAKMMDACKQKNDAKSWLGLAASSMTITSGLFDVASTAVKGMTKDINGDFDKGASLWSYQKLKLFGGLLSAGSAMIGATIDYEDFEKNSARGEDNIARLYLLKTIAGGVSSLMSVAGSLTYSTPYIRGLIKGIFLDTAAQIIKKEITLVAGRILLMAVGTGASLLVFTLQVLIWIFSDDELQSWCSLCAFGKERNTKAAFLSSAAQTTALNRALVSIDLAPAAAPSNNRFWESAPKPTIEEMKMYD
ncbi:T6SS effector BTH_I2691 family protein [Herbaspirillum rubrisubalbicans]|uniref:T6SS effector BTH_I2691 family protein n=1 Tax=Herbaspirillum rubrisubalbicans TaxID=80842 RepID=UPI0011BE9870|nr:T6SS effector BTH_I2691 family protein [Herbaspirillum rubrisubalbicans]